MAEERRMEKSVPFTLSDIYRLAVACLPSRFRRPAEVIAAPCGLDRRPLAPSL